MRKSCIPVVARPGLCIRADADTSVGTGHVMRCLALAQAARAAGIQTLFVGRLVSGVVQRLHCEGMRTLPLDADLSTADDLEILLQAADSTVAVVIDHYGLDVQYQQRVQAAGHPLLVIDDCNHQPAYAANLLLNQNVTASQYDYHTAARLLLGPQFALLRTEFLKYPRPAAERRNTLRKILLTLGGSDEHNITLQVLHALQSLPQTELDLKIVLGPACPWQAEIQHFLRHTSLKAKLLTHVTNMAELLAWADAAITAGGSTIYELAYFRLPAAVICLAENQRDVFMALEEKQMIYALHAGHLKSALADQLGQFLGNPYQACRYAAAIGELVDGQGAARVLAYMETGKI